MLWSISNLSRSKRGNSWALTVFGSCVFHFCTAFYRQPKRPYVRDQILRHHCRSVLEGASWNIISSFFRFPIGLRYMKGVARHDLFCCAPAILDLLESELSTDVLKTRPDVSIVGPPWEESIMEQLSSALPHFLIDAFQNAGAHLSERSVD